MTLQECYSQMNGNYEDVFARLGKEERIAKFLVRFLEAPSFNSLCEAMAASDWPKAFAAAHTLKGTTDTLGLHPLAHPASDLTELLRGGNPSDAAIAEARELFGKVEAAYATVAAAVTAFKASLQA